MIMKKYYFLSGLPRSGNTLLSSILNQNSHIRVSPNSALSDIVVHADSIKDGLVYKNFPNPKCHDHFIQNILNLYYEQWDFDCIIDRGPWGTPKNLEVLKKYYSKDIKILCPLRNTLQILCSFIIKLSESNIIDINDSVEIEKECDDLMAENSIIGKYFWSCENLLRKENNSYAYFFTYEDLVRDAEKIVHEIYEYLGIEKYSHRYKNFDQYTVDNLHYDDKTIGFDLHKIKPNLFLSEHNPEDILPHQVIKKYCNYNLT